MRQCPNCLENLDAHKQIAGDVGEPEAGDMTICIYCGFPLMFEDDNKMRILSADDLKEMDEDLRHALGHAFAQAERFNEKRKSN